MRERGSGKIDNRVNTCQMKRLDDTVMVSLAKMQAESVAHTRMN